MCRISQHLKLCTCAADVSTLKNYWVLYRFIEGKNDLLIGELRLPNYLDADDDAQNRKLLAELLNQVNIWDVDLTPVPNDRLLLSFTSPASQVFRYGFEYKNARWVECQYDSVEWQWHHDQAEKGQIENRS